MLPLSLAFQTYIVILHPLRNTSIISRIEFRGVQVCLLVGIDGGAALCLWLKTSDISHGSSLLVCLNRLLLSNVAYLVMTTIRLAHHKVPWDHPHANCDLVAE